MSVISQHILKYLNDFTKFPDPDFCVIYSKLLNPGKESAKTLLIYLDKVLNWCINIDEDRLNYTHIHFEDISYDQIQLMGEFIVIKFFHLGYINDNSDFENQELKEELETLNKLIKSDLLLNSATKRQSKQMRADRKGSKIRYGFLKNILKNKSLTPKSIINFQISNFNNLKERFKFEPYAIPVNEICKAKSYVLLNTESISAIKNKKVNNEYLLKLINNIVLFDCESRTSIFEKYNYLYLENLNKNHGTNFRNLFILSFNENGSRFSKIFNRLERIRIRFYNQPEGLKNQILTIIPEEAKHLTNRFSKAPIRLDFFGVESTTFWDDFINCTESFEDLYELRSIKLMNVYSFSFNEQIKNYIISDIFSSERPSKLITENTWETIQELSQDNINELRECLANTIDLIIQCNWLNFLKEHIHESSNLLLPELIINNPILLSETKIALSLKNRNKIVNWFEVDLNTDQNLVILDYRDVGHFPYRVNPNIIENTFPNSSEVIGLFLNIFFKPLFDWSNYNLSRDYFKILDHPLRKEFFNWVELKKTIQLIKPIRMNANLNLESKYYSSLGRNIIKIKFKCIKNSTSFNPAELFIIKRLDVDGYRVMRMDEISDIFTGESRLFVQQLDQLYSDFNLYEKIANKEREENELQIIRQAFAIDETDPGRLWKILLKRKAINEDVFSLYNNLSIFFKSKNLSLVSFNHFKLNWICSDSESLIPRGKKIFFELCQFLGLPKSYLRIMLRLKNAEVQSTRHSSKQMNDLLADLINDGCFDESKNITLILQEKRIRYLKKHDFDEIGIGEDQFIVEMTALIDLLKPNIKLKELENIEILSQ